MRSLYWEIFISFWVATILIIISTALITSEITQKSSISAQERYFMDSYANAAIATYEAGHRTALTTWLENIGLRKHLELYLLTNKGVIIGNQDIPPIVHTISSRFAADELDEGIFKSGPLILSHEIQSTSGQIYRLAAFNRDSPAYLVRLPWTKVILQLLIAIGISGFICYSLSIYLTKPLRSLRLAAKALGKGHLKTRVGHFLGHHKDEIAALSDAFDSMAAQLETLIQSKQRLLQDISHELRSPLARLQIALEMGRKKSQDLAEAEFDRIELECIRLNDLIGEILYFTRLDHSAETLQTQPIDLFNLLDNIIKDANYEFSQQMSRVVAGKIEHCHSLLDPRLIHRAIENILRNALRYSPEDKQVTVSLYTDKATQNIYIDIEDNGPGVPKEQLDAIFNPFYRVDTAREKNTGGYGLGLAIAKRAVMLHDGKVYAVNRQEGGLLVRIALPFKD